MLSPDVVIRGAVVVIEIIGTSCLWFCVFMSLEVGSVRSVSLFIEVGSLLTLYKVSFRFLLAWFAVASLFVVSLTFESYCLLPFIGLQRSARGLLMERRWMILMGRI